MRGRRGLALLLAVLLLAGCGTGADDSPNALARPVALSEARPEDDGVLASRIFSLACTPDEGFNPYRCTVQSNRTVLSLLYEPLFTVDSNFRAAPYLCESYEATGDGRTHTLTLRRDVTFSDGTPLVAEDVTASIRAAMGSPYYGGRLDHISTITATSDQELTITTDVAVGALDALLNVYVVKAGTVNDSVPLGTGPFVASGDTLHRTGWWRGRAPILTAGTVRLVAAETPNAVRDSFEYGLADLACADPNAGVQMTYHSDFELWDNTTTVMQYIGFNRSSPVFCYESIRCAVSHGIDREFIVSNTAEGFAQAASLPASPNAECYSKQLAENYDRDEAAFRADLEERSVADLTGADGILEFYDDYGVQALSGDMIVCMNSDQRVAAAQAVVDSLNAQGFDLTLRALEYDSYVAALKNGNFDLYYGEVRLSPDFDLSAFFNEGGSLSYGGCADAKAAQLCAQARENAGNAYDLHQEIMDRGLLCPVLFKVYAIYSARGRVTNLTPCLDGVFLQPMEEPS